MRNSILEKRFGRSIFDTRITPIKNGKKSDGGILPLV